MVKYSFSKEIGVIAKNSKFFFQRVANRKLSDIYHSHDFYEITAVFRGSGTHLINGEKIQQFEGDVVFLRPDDCHSFIKQSPDVIMISFSVEKREFEKMADVFSAELLDDLNSKSMPKIFHCPNLLANINLNHNVVKSDYEEHDLKFLLSFFLKEYIDALGQEKSGLPKNLAYAIKEMQNQDNLKMGVPKFVELSFYSHSHLSRLIKEHFNMTLHDYVLNLRLNAAYNDLILTGESTETIAEKFGYASLSHFNKIFKEKFKATPAEIRKTRGVRTV